MGMSCCKYTRYLKKLKKNLEEHLKGNEEVHWSYYTIKTLNIGETKLTYTNDQMKNRKEAV